MNQGQTDQATHHVQKHNNLLNSLKNNQNFVPIVNQDKSRIVPQAVKFEYSEMDRPVIPEECDPTKKNQPIENHKIYRRVQDMAHADACAWTFTSPYIMEKYFYLHPGLAARDVRIRVMYSSLCHSDSSTLRGLWGPMMYPLCAGHEIVGEVVAIGPLVTKFKVGDKVMYGPTRSSCGTCLYCIEGKNNLCTTMPKPLKDIYGQFWGGYSTHIQHPESHCFKLPNGMDIETAPPVMCAGVTMYKPLAQQCKKGQKIGIIGIGGLGHVGIQIAVKMGMEVDAFISMNDANPKDRIVPEFGATRVIHWNTDDLTNLANTYDVILNTIPIGIPAEKMDSLLNCLKPMGKFIVIGLPALEDKLTFNYRTIVRKNIEVIGTLNGSTKETEETINFCAKNNIKARCEFFSFEDFPKAFDKMENGLPLFRLVLRVDDFSKQFRR
jgi:uncharacterized zinc-type alcohol dehydrogenase-like protein